MERDGRKLSNAREASERLSVAVSTLYGLAREHRIPHIRIGDRILFDVEEIIAASRIPAEGEFTLSGRR